MSELVIYEYPLNERIRTLLRLEHLFKQVDFFLPQEEDWHSRAAVSGLLEIISAFARTDLKTEILKELERQSSKLNRLPKGEGINMETLGAILDDLEQSGQRIFTLNGQIGKRLRENEFLLAISQRNSIPGGTCSFDLPQYHAWLQQPHGTRQQQMLGWMSDLEPIQSAIALLVSLTRESATASDEVAQRGVYQRVLDANTPTQMVRVGMPRGVTVFPEISGNKHRFNIRFLESHNLEQRPMQSVRDVEFELTCCVL